MPVCMISVSQHGNIERTKLNKEIGLLPSLNMFCTQILAKLYNIMKGNYTALLKYNKLSTHIVLGYVCTGYIDKWIQNINLILITLSNRVWQNELLTRVCKPHLKLFGLGHVAYSEKTATEALRFVSVSFVVVSISPLCNCKHPNRNCIVYPEQSLKCFENAP